ncbi:hypothetical protein BGZ81_010364 [Podila clonocystis]|nr:hypothetical protein BGZ81_010364 [Podila clonocystis]
MNHNQVVNSVFHHFAQWYDSPSSNSKDHRSQENASDSSLLLLRDISFPNDQFRLDDTKMRARANKTRHKARLTSSIKSAPQVHRVHPYKGLPDFDKEAILDPAAAQIQANNVRLLAQLAQSWAMSTQQLAESAQQQFEFALPKFNPTFTLKAPLPPNTTAFDRQAFLDPPSSLPKMDVPTITVIPQAHISDAEMSTMPRCLLGIRYLTHP